MTIKFLKFFFSLTVLFCYLGTIKAQNNHLIILSDDDCVESPYLSKPMDGLTITLDFFINEEAAPILVSQSVLLQFAKTQATKTTTEQCKTNSIYISRVWQNNKQGSLPTSYYLIIPKQLASKKFLSQEFKENHTTFGQQLALNASFGIRSEVLTTIDQTSWAHVIKHLEGNLFGVGFSSEFWKDFFLSDNYVSGPSNVLLKPWSFMFFCHGKPHDMVGISQQDVQKFFLFLSEELNTKVVALTSCFIGGHLKDKLCTAPDGRPLAFTFNLITSSLNDVPLVLQKNQYTRGLTQQLFEKCDEEAINLATILNLFTRLVTPVGTYVSHGQIRAAGCERFEIPQHYSDLVKLTPSKNVSPLQNKKRKLINTEEFASCLFTSPQHPSITHQKKEATPVKATFTTKTIALGEKMFNRPLQISPTIRFPSQQTLLVCADYYLKNFLERPLLDIDSSLVILHEAFALAKERNQPLSLPIPTYPDMISTLYDEQPTSTAQRTSTHFLEKIVLSNEDEGGINPFLGILSFIRDGFFCSQYRLSKNCICIKKLQGFNDLSLLFECMNIKDNEEIEDALQPLANQVIELTNVIIETEPTSASFNCYVAFAIDLNQKTGSPSLWKSFSCSIKLPSPYKKEGIDSNDPCLWSFETTELDDHEDLFHEVINALLPQKHPFQVLIVD